MKRPGQKWKTCSSSLSSLPYRLKLVYLSICSAPHGRGAHPYADSIFNISSPSSGLASFPGGGFVFSCEQSSCAWNQNGFPKTPRPLANLTSEVTYSPRIYRHTSPAVWQGAEVC